MLLMQARDGGAIVAAEQLLHIARERRMVLTPMQVLKLVYISHGWMLGLHQRPLFNENVEVWKFGPVVPGVYHKYKKFRADQIKSPGKDHEKDMEGLKRNMIGQVFDGYVTYTGIQLSELTHQEGSPWDTAWKGGMDIIPNDLIQMHYAKLGQDVSVRTRALHGNG